MYLDKRVVRALDLLTEAGFAAYLVGGCVRDYIMGNAAHDFDITTDARPEQIKAIFQSYTTLDFGMQHGTITVVLAGLSIEITTFRIDGEYLDKRRPAQVVFSDSLEADLSRRDFTINAIAYNTRDGFQDFFGGSVDINNKLIRAVGQADKRFAEDALRILRGLRFAAVLGFAIERETARAMFANKELLKNISVERIFVEFKKLLCGQQAAGILNEFIEIFAVIIPELLPMKGFAQHNPYHSYDVLTHTLKAVSNVDSQAHLRLAALFHDIGKPATFTRGADGIGHFYGHMNVSTNLTEAILTRLHADNETKKKVVTLVKYHDTQIIAEEKYVKRWLHKLGIVTFNDLLALKKGDMIGQKGNINDPRLAGLLELERLAQQVVATGEAFNLKSLAVSGHELLELGIPQGQQLGIILNRLLELVIEGELVNRREELIKYVKETFC